MAPAQGVALTRYAVLEAIAAELERHGHVHHCIPCAQRVLQWLEAKSAVLLSGDANQVEIPWYRWKESAYRNFCRIYPVGLGVQPTQAGLALAEYVFGPEHYVLHTPTVGGMRVLSYWERAIVRL